MLIINNVRFIFRTTDCSLLLIGIPYLFGKWDNKKSILYLGNLIYVFNRLLHDKINSNNFIVSDD